MSSISGIQGLKPTIEIIKYTNKIAIANKEAIICGWDLIKKNLDLIFSISYKEYNKKWAYDLKCVSLKKD